MGPPEGLALAKVINPVLHNIMYPRERKGQVFGICLSGPD